MDSKVVVADFCTLLQSGSIALGLSRNNELISGLEDSTILNCLVAWGVIVVTEDETVSVIAAAAAAATTAAGDGGSTIAAQNLYYRVSSLCHVF